MAGLGRSLGDVIVEAGIGVPQDVTVDNLARLPKVGSVRANRLLSSFLAATPVYEVLEILVPAGVEPRLAARVVDSFGPPAPRLLRDDPWRLLTLHGVNLADADRVARVAIPGVRREDSRRSRALVAFVLAREAREGHTVTLRDTIVDALREFSVGDADTAIDAALEAALVVDVAPELLSPTRLAEAEDGVAEGISRLQATAEPITARVAETGLDDAQRDAVESALREGVSVLTGGPAPARAARSRRWCRWPRRPASRSRWPLRPDAPRSGWRSCATPPRPRCTGCWGRSRGRVGDDISFDGRFARGADWPLDEDVVVVDEASMLDVELAEALLSACSDGTHLVFVGDAAQLPSIGPGRVLGDLIESGAVHVTELTTLYRQAVGGSIARLAAAVRGGELPPVSDPTHEVVIVPARGSAEAAHRVVQLVTDSIPRALGVPSDQVQVVTPVHRGGAGTQALNAVLKKALNPGAGRGRFDAGDRVVATANHPEAEPVGYANGEVGTVDQVRPDGTVVVEFAGGPAAVKGKALADLLHGWAITVHRAQGSEFPAVVVVLPSEASAMLSRPLVYTALTRAQKHLSVVHAVGPAVTRAVRQIGTVPRRTRLVALLSGA